MLLSFALIYPRTPLKALAFGQPKMKMRMRRKRSSSWSVCWEPLRAWAKPGPEMWRPNVSTRHLKKSCPQRLPNKREDVLGDRSVIACCIVRIQRELCSAWADDLVACCVGLARAGAVTEHHRRGGWRDRNDFLTVLEAGSVGSRGWQCWLLLKHLSLACKWPSVSVSSSLLTRTPVRPDLGPPQGPLSWPCPCLSIVACWGTWR